MTRTAIVGPSSPIARVVWVIAAVGVAIVGLLIASYARLGANATLVEAVAGVSLAGSLVAFILCGALIVSRRPRNIVGWLLMIPGLVLPVGTLATNWLGSIDPPQQVTPLLWLGLWALGWSWILLIFPIFHLLLTFPDGRLLSPRWRLAVALELTMSAIFIAFTGLAEHLGVLVNDEVVWSVQNPIGFLPNDLFDGWVGSVWQAGLMVMTIASVAAVVVRFHRGSTVERQQLKWPLVAVVIFGVVYAAAAVDSNLVASSILFGVALAGIPISVAIAVLRYRLYAIDHIISRTIGWAVVTAVLVAVFAGVVVVLQALLTPVTRENTLAVAASTLVAFALFQPLRRRVQRAVDRRFDRARYDGQRTVDAFAERLRTEVDLPTLRESLATTADEAVRPSTATVWLAKGTG